MRCTKNILLHFGQPTKSISTRTSKTGKNSTPIKNISSRMFLPSSPPVMESSWKTSPNSSAPKCKSHKPDASTDSKWPWKTSTQRLTLSWLTITLRIKNKRNIFSMQSKILMWLNKKLSGLWNGWTNKNQSMSDWSLLPPFKAFSFPDHSVQFSGSKRDLSCLV